MLNKQHKNKFYVYVHKTSPNGTVFYIGKGTGNRAYSESKRTENWKKIVSENDYCVELLYVNLTGDEALEIEYTLLKNPNPEWQLCNSQFGYTEYNNVEEIKNLFEYSTEVPGFLLWKDRLTNSRPNDGIAGYADSRGYWRTRVGDINYLNHRIVYELFNGKIPKGKIINHKDRNPSNNNIENLEMVDHKGNAQNKAEPKVREIRSKIDGRILSYQARWCDVNNIPRSKNFKVLTTTEDATRDALNHQEQEKRKSLLT